MNEQTTIGDRLNIAIKRRGVMKKVFADQIGVTPNYISMIIKGKNYPSDLLIEKICKTLNVRQEWFVTGEGEIDAPNAESVILADLVNELLTWESDEFRARLISALIRLPLDDWSMIEKFIDSLQQE